MFCSFFILAINPAHLGASNYAAQVENILTHVRDSAPAPGKEGVSIPGDRSAQVFMQNNSNGKVNVADKTLENIKELAQ